MEYDPNLHVRRQPAEDMQILMSERKKAEVIALHGFTHKGRHKSEVIHEITLIYIRIPADDFRVIPGSRGH